MVVLAALVAALGAAPAQASPASGSVLAWGCGFQDYGQCTVPAGAASGVTALAAGDWHSLALRSDGSVACWGSDDYDQCVPPAAAASGVSAVAAAAFHSLALKGGAVLSWGCLGWDYGQCTVPAGATSGVTAIAASHNHSLALKSGSVLAWGCDGYDQGQCTVPGGAATGVSAIAAGCYHSMALKSDGSVLAWGCIGADYGQCTVPAQATSGVSGIAAGADHSLAIDAAGPTAVTLRTFQASRTASGTLLHWRTASEMQALGFNLYREQRGKLVKLNRTLIPSVFGGTTSGHAYSFLDRRAPVASGTIRYRLQAVNVDGTRRWVGSAPVAH